MSIKVESSDEHETAESVVPLRPFGAPYVRVLAVVEGRDPSAAYRLVQGETVLGRGEEAAVDIDDPEISKRHCAIRVDGPVCSVADLGSLNGTIVNARRLRPDVIHRLRHLDEIRIGDTRLLFLAARFRERG